MRALLIPLLLLFSACASTPARSTGDPSHANAGVAADSKPADAEAVDYSCKTDADCEVKNVGNCCGYFPACVNHDSATFPDRVKAECAKKGMTGVCGFPDVKGCSCVEGRCSDAPAGNTTR